MGERMREDQIDILRRIKIPIYCGRIWVDIRQCDALRKEGWLLSVDEIEKTEEYGVIYLVSMDARDPSIKRSPTPPIPTCNKDHLPNLLWDTTYWWYTQEERRKKNKET